MAVTKKTYTPLVEVPAVLILSCAQVLPNKCQCWRGADFLVEEELPVTAAAPAPEKQKEEPKAEAVKAEAVKAKAAEAAKPEPKATTPTRVYQLCAMHATIQQRADALALQEEQSTGKPSLEDSDPKSIHSRMMQAEQRQRQSTMPVGN